MTRPSFWTEVSSSAATGWRPGQPMPPPTKCDFCSEPITGHTLIRFGCATFYRRAVIRTQADGMVMLAEVCHCHTPIAPQPGDDTVEDGVHGDWAACVDCADLVWADNRRGLARRAARMMRQRRPELARGALPPTTVVDAETGHACIIIAPSWDHVFAVSHLGFFLHRITEDTTEEVPPL